VFPLRETVPDTFATPLFSVNVVVVKVAALIGSLNVAVTVAFDATPVWLLVGLVEDTEGGVVSPGGGVEAGLSAGSPGYVSAVISARFENPSPSESLPSTAVILAVISAPAVDLISCP
jgi:hypothetical protein